MLVELVRTVTRDGLRLDGALAPGSVSAGATRTAAVLLHGVGGNFYTSSTFEPLIPRLQELGLTALTVNTRGRDSVFGASQGTVRRRWGAAYEIVDDCRHDVAAWVNYAQARGYERVLLIGHSLGAVKALYSQAHEGLAAVCAVVAVSPPRLSYSAFLNAADSSAFWESMRTAEELVQAGRGQDLFTSKYPFPLLITAASYIDKYGPAERYNLLKFADRVSCHSHFFYGSKELASGGTPFEGLPEALSALPSSGPRSIRVVEGADHFYTGVTDQLAEQVAAWIRQFVLNAQS